MPSIRGPGRTFMSRLERLSSDGTMREQKVGGV